MIASLCLKCFFRKEREDFCRKGRLTDMECTKKILRRCVVPFLAMGLAGCYYPVPVYPPYPPPPSYAAYPYGYAPPPQGYPYRVAHDGQECREYTKPAIIEGEKQRVTGTACRQPDGTWKDTVSGAPVHEPPVAENTGASVNAPAAPYAPPAYENGPVAGR